MTGCQGSSLRCEDNCQNEFRRIKLGNNKKYFLGLSRNSGKILLRKIA